MDVYEAVSTLLAIRDYEDKPVSQKSLERILEAARLTASSRNTQEWDFVVIQEKETLEQLGQLARTGRYIADAPLAIAVVVPDKSIGYVDGARAVQDMMLVAWADGIGSNWVSNVNNSEVKGLLGIPEERLLLAIIPFGYPVQAVGAGEKDRKPLAEIVHAEKWGQRYGG